MNHQSKVRRSLLLAVFLLAAATSPVMAGAAAPVLTVTKESRISVDVDNQPLDALLRMMAEKRLFDIRGGVAGNESLTFHFSNLTLPEILSKILRGYNYAVIDQGKNQLPVLTVMGRVQERAVAGHADTPAPEAAPAELRSYVPPESPPPLATPQPGLPHRPPMAQSHTTLEVQPVGEAGRQTGQTAPAIQPGQAAESTGVGAKELLSGQPGGEAQGQQAGQQAAGGEPAPRAEAPPAESPGIHF
ncbi:MAG: hypothetical protein ABSB94_16380 [Syntrophorhabdales bacterium]|jgi:hypothetical protein